MCVKTAINAQLKKINRATNAIKKINHMTAAITCNQRSWKSY